jgi:tetratricopeptide (TPR) repeat protein
LVRAASHYLTLGDRAFREGRYSDAVHFYAKAVEFSPDEGVLHLILADALFATGDYHYAAYALRRAFELDPQLADSVVDKHGFYGDPTEFDRQIALLERYLEDHFIDDDARLVLAANYLFGNRPSQALDLLDSAFSLGLRETHAGKVLHTRASQLVQPVVKPEAK